MFGLGYLTYFKNNSHTTFFKNYSGSGIIDNIFYPLINSNNNNNIDTDDYDEEEKSDQSIIIHEYKYAKTAQDFEIKM